MFMERFFNKFEKRKDMDFYKSRDVSNHSNKFKVTATLLPYEIQRHAEFNLKERVGYIKENLAY